MQKKRAAGARILVWASAGFLTTWLGACILVFVLVPPVAPRHPLDAVIVLGGASSERLPEAVATAALAPGATLVISRTDTPGNAEADELCKTRALPETTLVCFQPHSMDTRGEAVSISQLVAANGWTSIAVVTSSYHVARAGLLIGQCTTATISMVAAPPDLGLLEWLQRFVVETGGLLDVAVRPECRP